MGWVHRREVHWGGLGCTGALPLAGIRLRWGRGTAGLGCTGGTGESWAPAALGSAAGVRGAAGAWGVGCRGALPPPRDWGALGCPQDWGVPGVSPGGTGCPGVSPGSGCPGVSPGIGVPWDVPGDRVPWDVFRDWGAPGCPQDLGCPGVFPRIGVSLRCPWGVGCPGMSPGGTGCPGMSLGLGCPRVSPGFGVPWGVPREWVPWDIFRDGGVPTDQVPWAVPRLGVPGAVPGAGGRAVVARRSLTVVELVVGLLLAAVGRDAVDLHAHEGVHDGAALLPVQLGQLLRRDHLGTEGSGCMGRGGWGHGCHRAACGDRAGVPRRRDAGGTRPGVGMGSLSPRSRDIDGTRTDVRT